MTYQPWPEGGADRLEQDLLDRWARHQEDAAAAAPQSQVEFDVLIAHQVLVEQPNGLEDSPAIATEGDGIHHYESSGRYIDDISIQKQLVRVLPMCEGLESGWNGWYDKRGVWELGSGSTDTGSNSMGRVYTGNYPWQQTSRLVSPVIELPPVADGEEIV